MSIPVGSQAVRPQLKVDRLSRNLLFTTAFIQTQVGPGLVSTGTSFFYDADLSGGADGMKMPMLVTNKHVVRGATSGVIRLIRAEEGMPSLGNPVHIEFTEADWVGHPDPDVDVAVTSIGTALNKLAAKGSPAFFRVIGRDVLATPEEIAELEVVEPVTFVGYPASLFDTANLTPIVRRGTTATPIQLDYCGSPQFLIDASIFPGSSGSPVFLIQEHGYRKNGTYLMGHTRILFLGVVAAVHQHVGTGRIVTSTTPEVKFDQMVDLGLVFKASAVEQAIDEFCRQRGLDRGAVTPTGPDVDAG